MADMLITQESDGRIDIQTSPGSSDRYEDADGTCLVTGPRYRRPAAGELAAAFRRSPQNAADIHGHFVAMYYDKNKKTATVLRDKAGYERAYYAPTARGWACSTSLSWLARHRNRTGVRNQLSLTGIALYLAFQYIPTPYSPLRDVMQVPLGGNVTLGSSRPPVIQHPNSRPWATGTAISTARELTEHAAVVLEILRGDIAAWQVSMTGQVGMLLSGGMDSSTNAAVCTQFLGLRPLGFTAQFTEAGYDETESAQAVARPYQIEHHVVPISAAGLAELPHLVRAFDSPNADQACYAEWSVAKAAAAAGCEWIITGEGGDEVLGYPQAHDDDLRPRQLPTDNYALAEYYFGKTHLADGEIRHTLYERLGVDPNLQYEVLASIYQQYSDRTPFERVLFGQWATWLIDGVYQKDRSVFRSAGIEPVLPFTGKHLMDYVSDVPAEHKLRGLDDKQFLRTALSEVLPAAVLQKPKHKFWLPFEKWFREASTDAFLREHLLSDGLVTELFGGDLPKRLVTEHAQRQADHSRLLWTLLFLDVWYQQHASSWASLPS